MDNDFELEPGDRIWIHEIVCCMDEKYRPEKYTIYHIGKRPKGDIHWYCPSPCLERHCILKSEAVEWNVVKEIPPGAVDTLIPWLPDNIEDYFNENDPPK